MGVLDDFVDFGVLLALAVGLDEDEGDVEVDGRVDGVFEGHFDSDGAILGDSDGTSLGDSDGASLGDGDSDGIKLILGDSD